jgi:predicted ATPase
MSITIKATQEKSILISGTEIPLTEVYGRLEFVGRASGLTLEIATSTFVNKTTYEEGKLLFTDIPAGNINASLEIDEEQSLATAHKYAKLAYEQLGYEVIVNI